MKYFLFLIFPSLLCAKPRYVDIGKCYQSNVLMMSVVKKIEKNQYEIVSGRSERVCGYSCYGAGFSDLAILKTKTKISKPGPFYLMVKYLKTIDVESTNGFDSKADIWEECK